MLNIEVFSFATAALFFLSLSLVLLTGRRGQILKSLLAAATLSSAMWSAVVAYQAAYGGLLIIAQLLELLRELTWFAFLLLLLRTAYSATKQVVARFWITLGVISAFTAALMLLALYRISGGSALESIAGNDVLAGHLLMAVGGLVLVEQLYRTTPREQRRSIKYLCLAIGGMFTYDFYLYSDALLFERVSAVLWNARGFIHAMVVPVIAIALSRNMQWSLKKDAIDVFVSPRAAFHTTALLGAGIYLLAMGAGGYYVRVQGGAWGLVAQAIFLFGAGLVLAILLFSGQLRASLRVLISKHFFHYKYDYREEWLRFIRTLSSGEPETQLRERAIKALAQIMESPGGILWLRRDNGHFDLTARWGMDESAPSVETADGTLVRFLEEKEWVINLDEHKPEFELHRSLIGPRLPQWLVGMPRAWLVVPLILHEQLMGFVVLARSPLVPVQHHFNWEDCDLLKTAGRQAASHLAQLEASRALTEARQFEAFNHLSAFVVHDLKNLVAQLSLVVSNSAKHRNNPQFMEDTIMTVDNSVSRMNRLLGQLRNEGGRNDQVANIDVGKILSETVGATKTNGPAISVDSQKNAIIVRANRDRFASIIGHIIQNARDATPSNGRIMIRLRENGENALIEIEDTGSGMDDTFIRERLFRPFETTKGKAGMGIGAYETREFIRSLGGEVAVFSRLGHGTIFRLQIPRYIPGLGDINYKTSNG